MHSRGLLERCCGRPLLCGHAEFQRRSGQRTSARCWRFLAGKAANLPRISSPPALRLRPFGTAIKVNSVELEAANAAWGAADCSSKSGAAVASCALGGKVRILSDEIRRPPQDPRRYRAVELSNGLQVLLAVDPSADMASAALSIRCGSFQDPDSRPGLAHFHEHMLFLGTERYPREDEYIQFLSQHGGDSNAYTQGEYTTYFFKVAAESMDGALDRFSEFFVSPRFEPSCVEREMCAVDSESTNYSTEDTWRLLQVLRSTASDDHPFHRFDVGNLSTLGAEDPQAARAEIVTWNKDHYLASSMRLAVVAKTDDMDALQRCVVELFDRVPAGRGRLERPLCEPWPLHKLGRFFRCVPLKDVRTISVCWPLPPQAKYLLSKPELYLAHVFGHEGPGSLHDVLNQRGWVDQLSAGSAHAFSDAQLFALNVSLTPEGDANREEVLALIFDAVALVRRAGAQEEMFRELAALQEIAFAHQEDAPAIDDFAAAAAGALHLYSAAEVLRGPFAIDEWRPDVISEYLSLLVPQRCLVFCTSPLFEAEAAASAASAVSDHSWKREAWYGAIFREQPLHEACLWVEHSSPDVDEVAAARAEEAGLQPSAPNSFVPSDFSLRSNGASAGSCADERIRSRLPVEVTPPLLLLADGRLRLWHKLDFAFRTPRTHALARIRTDAYRTGPAAVVAARLLCGVVTDDLNSTAYDASIAGLSYSLEFSDDFIFCVSGFSDKLPLLLRLVVNRVVEVMEDARRGVEDYSDRAAELLEKLEVQRQILLQDYRNLVREEPWSISSYYTSMFMLRESWHISEYGAVLDRPPCLSTLADDAKKVFSNAQLEMLVHGNALADEAILLADVVAEALVPSSGVPLLEFNERQVTMVDAGSTIIFEYDLARENPAQENSCAQVIFQVGPLGEDWSRDACLDLLCHLASTSAYHRLRTEEQLGYVVQAGAWAEQHVGGLQVLVQGNRLHPRDVDDRIEAWLRLFGEQLHEMSEAHFADNVRATVNTAARRYASLAQEATRHWAEIAPRRYRFDSLPRIVEALNALEKREVLVFFHEYFLEGSPSRRKFSSRVLGTSAREQPFEAKEGCGDGTTVVRNLDEIRDLQTRLPSFPKRFCEDPFRQSLNKL